jgi:protochlorophyllide reductase
LQLCNVLFTRELQRRLDANDKTKGITANSFTPGLIVGTGFFRNQNPIFTKVRAVTLSLSLLGRRHYRRCIMLWKNFSPAFFLNDCNHMLIQLPTPFLPQAFDLVATDLVRVGETPSFGGGCLAYMTTLDSTSRGQYYGSPPGSCKYGDAAYGNQFTVEPISKEARDDLKAKRLWELSEQLLGIDSTGKAWSSSPTITELHC